MVNTINKVLIESTKNTPFIYFDLDENKFEIKGRSIPLNAAEFYAQLITWLEQNIKEKNRVEMNFEMDYFNTSSFKYIIQIITILSDTNKENTFKWFYEKDDDEMYEVGMKIQVLTDSNFEFIRLNN